MEDPSKQNPFQGVLYLLVTLGSFSLFLLWGGSKGFTDWKVTYEWLEPAATAAELATFVGAISAAILPAGFCWVFGRLFKRLAELWRWMKGDDRQIQREDTLPKPDPPIRQRRAVVPLNGGPLRPPEVAQVDWQPWAILAVIVASFVATALLRTNKPPQPAARSPLDESITVPPVTPIPPQVVPTQPTDLTISTERSCIAIATRYCPQGSWSDFTAANPKIRVYMRAGQPFCTIYAGRTYAWPAKWTSAYCGVSTTKNP